MEADDKRIELLALVRISTASISAISSSLIIFLIARSNRRFSSIQNRLLTCMSISDIISSLAMSMVSIPMPRGTPNVWKALGNTATCELQGFLLHFGSTVTPCYNAAICLCCLFKIRYNMTDQVIEKRWEPFFHGVPIIGTFAVCIYYTVKGYFNASVDVCYLAELPRDCTKEEDITCERGGGSMDDWLPFISAGIHIVLVPGVIVTSMIGTYTAARENDQSRNLRFGRMSLTTLDRGSTGSVVTSQSVVARAILHKALAYTGAWALPQIATTIYIGNRLITGKYPSFALRLILACFHPLQGLFNFCVLIYPILAQARERFPNDPWCVLFVWVLKSDIGETLRTGRSQRRGSGAPLERIDILDHNAVAVALTVDGDRQTTEADRQTTEVGNAELLASDVTSNVLHSDLNTGKRAEASLPSFEKGTQEIASSLEERCLQNSDLFNIDQLSEDAAGGGPGKGILKSDDSASSLSEDSKNEEEEIAHKKEPRKPPQDVGTASNSKGNVPKKFRWKGDKSNSSSSNEDKK